MRKIFTSEWSKTNKNSGNQSRCHVFMLETHQEFEELCSRLKEHKDFNRYDFKGVREFFGIDVDDSWTYYSSSGPYEMICELRKG